MKLHFNYIDMWLFFKPKAGTDELDQVEDFPREQIREGNCVIMYAADLREIGNPPPKKKKNKNHF